MTGRRRLPALVAVLTGVLLLAGAVSGLGSGRGVDGGPAGAAPAAGRGGSPAGPPVGADALSAAIRQTQQRLRAVPGDPAAWAALGAGYVQQARVTADPTYYPKAEGALRRSLALRPGGDAAMVGMGALANSRHDFAAARAWAVRAQRVNPYGSASYGVLADALTQLGDYPGATAAVQRMLDLKPGLSAFTRASYDLETHGRPAEAATALQRALADATSPADIAFCRYYLGELAFNGGRLAEASEHYEAGWTADPSYAPLLEGRAKVAAAQGRRDAAVGLYAQAVAVTPLPAYLIGYGEYLESVGRPADARRQYSLVATEQRLFAANGVSDDLTTAQLAADHGDPAVALRAARAEWGRRHSVLVADALAWALHVSGRDAEALGYARTATSLGWRNATFLYHRGMIEAALSRSDPARRDAAQRDLAAALSVNPHFSPLAAPLARAELSRPGGGR